MRTPTVSVVLTSYNQAQWLDESITSVLTQTYEDWELILVDNGSTDESLRIVDRHRNDPRITVVCYERNSAHTAVSNDAIRRARGRFVSFLYSDDYYLPHKLERQVDAFARLPDTYGVVYSAGYRLYPGGELRLQPCGTHRGHVLRPILTELQFFMPIAPLVRRECLLHYPFNEAIFMEGEGIFTKIALRYLFHPLPDPLVVMRDHEGNMGKEIGDNMRRGLVMLQELFRHPEFPPELRYLRGRLLGETYRLGGWQTIRRERQYRDGRSWLWSALRADPRLVRDPRVMGGLALAWLPRRLADACLDGLDRAVGAPPPPMRRPPTPFEGRRGSEP